MPNYVAHIVTLVGSDEAYELYFQTHEWARDEMHKNEKGKWVWNED